MTGLNLQTTFEFGGDRGMLERTSNAFRNPRPLMLQIGVLGMNSAVTRLTTVLRADNDVRSGKLASSVRVSAEGAGDENTVFRLTDDSVEIGTNLRYAAQVNFGGTIFPRPPRKALAIPLFDTIARSGIGPAEADPGREHLSFVPVRSKTSKVIGLLVDDENVFGRGEGAALYALASSVTQIARPYLFWSDDDQRVIREELYPNFLGLE